MNYNTETEELLEEIENGAKQANGPTIHLIRSLKPLIKSNFLTIQSNKNVEARLRELSQNIKDSDEQSRKLELSNYRLQIAMLILTAIATMIVAYPLFVKIITWIFELIKVNVHLGIYDVSIISLIAGLLTGFVSYSIVNVEKKVIEIKLRDTVKIKDSISAVVLDKDGNIKDKRSSG